MEHAAPDLDSRHPPGVAEVTDGADRAGEATHEILWYSVGVLLVLLAAATTLVFCFSGGWTG